MSTPLEVIKKGEQEFEDALFQYETVASKDGFTEQYPTIEYKRGKVFLKRQTLALLQALHDELEEKEQVLKAHSEAHHEQFLKDELAHKHGQTLKTLEVMKMHEGSTSAYRGGILDGKMEAIQDQKNNLQALKEKIQA